MRVVETWLWVWGVVGVEAHIRLVFPPARHPPLDFLDTFRTPAPCGLPSPPNGTRTRLIAGESYNFSWFMAYAHQGGYKFSILDKNGNVIRNMTPPAPTTNGFTGTTQPTQESRWFIIPADMSCELCTLRMEREAREWGKHYSFHSCADISILSPNNVLAVESRCSGSGKFNSATSKCDCNVLYSGEQCQYKDDCLTEEDCSGKGKCVELGGTSYPKNVCFCASSYFGTYCQKQFVPVEEDKLEDCFNYAYDFTSKRSPSFTKYSLFNPTCYKTATNTLGDSIHFRLIEDEQVEVILEYDTESWAALGWRPKELNSDCKMFPLLKDTMLTKQGSQSEPQPSAELKTVGKPEPEPTAEGRSQAEPSAESEPTSEPDPTAEGHSAAEHEPSGEAEPTAADETEETDYYPHDFHPMDCLDIVVGSARGQYSRVGDFYTRDRSTPLPDSVYGGGDDLSAAYGLEINGTTIILFRKPKKAAEKTDHSLDRTLQIVWAKGKAKERYLDTTSQTMGGKDFYPQDRLKYHGASHRGTFSLQHLVPSSAARPHPHTPTTTYTIFTLLFLLLPILC